jgi:DNA-binding beta-propeller fold protein YncE
MRSEGAGEVSPGRSAARRRVIKRGRTAALGTLIALIAIAAIVIAKDEEGRPPGAGSAARPGASRAGAGQAARGVSPHAAPSLRARGTASVNLRPGSDPSVLPAPVLIADDDNNRLLEVDPTGRVLWRFPAPGDLSRGQTFKRPDDAFFSPDGRQLIVTQEDDFVITVINLARRRIVYRYGHPGVPGSEPGYVNNPDDALLMPSGEILAADIKNCRVIVIHPPAHTLLRQLGITGSCTHQLGTSYGSPNGAFPLSDGGTAITEINGNWLDVLSRDGRPVLDTHPPGFTYPSDTNEVRPGLFLSADYTSPGALETFTSDGRLRWRYAPQGPQALNQPSLALPLPNGDILANDDKNHRVIVIDPRTNKIVWQYGHTHVPGAGDGFLNNPDGVDLAPPYSLAARFAATLHAP